MLESVPNLSEGRDPAKLAALREAFSAPARLVDVHSDEDHNRSVFTLLGTGDELVETLAAGVERAIGLIDLREHEGVHPRVGAVDVVPLVFLRPEDEPLAREAALAVTERIAALGIPVHHYGRLTADLREPRFFRSTGLARLVPAAGPDEPHPTAGAVLVGVRAPLVALNVNLRTQDLAPAREIAAAIRESGGGFSGLRALGLALPRAGVTQVSMNVTDPNAAPLREIVARIEAEARERGVEVAGTELVGLVPEASAEGLQGLDRSRFLESYL